MSCGAVAKVTMEITDIVDESELGIRVVCKGSGATPWLPKGCLDFWPGAVRVPEWLLKRLKKGRITIAE